VNATLAGATQALGWALVHFLWQGIVVAVALKATLELLRRFSSQARYLTACVALAPLAAAPVVTFCTSAHAPLAPASGTLRHALDTKMMAPGRPPETFVSKPAFRVAVMRTQAAEDCRRWFEARLGWIVSAWAGGVFLLGMRAAAGCARIKRLVYEGASLADSIWLERLNMAAQRLGVTRSVQLLQSTLVEVPTALGWLRPVILVPTGCLTGLTPAQLQAILAHELAHIRRHDYVVNLAQTVVETLLFYRPAVWWVSRQIRVEREHCCDDLVVGTCADRIEYARALASLEERRRPSGQWALAAAGGPLLKRIQRLLGQPVERRFPDGWLAGIAVFTAAILLIGAERSSLFPVRENAAPTPSRPATLQSRNAPLPSDPPDGNHRNEAVPLEFILKKLEHEARQEQTNVAVAKRILDDFARENSLSGSFEDNENSELQALKQLRVDHARAEAEAVLARRNVEQCDEVLRSGSPVASIPGVANHHAMQQLQKELALAEAEFAEIKHRYKSSHPAYVQAEEKVASLKASLSEQADEIVATLRNQAQIAQTTEEKLSALVEKYRQQQSARMEYSVLKRKAEAAGILYNTVLSKFRDIAAELLQSAETARQRGDTDEAERQVTSILNLDPANPAALKLQREIAPTRDSRAAANNRTSPPSDNQPGSNSTLISEADPAASGASVTRDPAGSLLSQVSITSRFAEIDPSELRALGLNAASESDRALTVTNWSGVVTDPQAFNNRDKPLQDFMARKPALRAGKARILTSAEAQRILKNIMEKGGGDILSAPRVTTLSGRQAQVQVIDLKSVVLLGEPDAPTSKAGSYVTRPAPTGPTVDLLPSVLPDGRTIQLTVTPSFTEFLGYDDPGPFKPASDATGKPITVVPLPHFRIRRTTVNAPIPDGHCLVIAGFGELSPARGQGQSAPGKQLLIFITPSLIDECGNRIHAE
jgi:beta-lactamase regulating signal transducer with metallopeptidase domain